ncbi:hypothetical protein ACFL35_12815 [Candidatus Riflebacteria bacterium]
MNPAIDDSLTCPYCFYNYSNPGDFPEIGFANCEKCHRKFYFQKKVILNPPFQTKYFDTWKNARVEPAYDFLYTEDKKKAVIIMQLLETIAKFSEENLQGLLERVREKAGKIEEEKEEPAADDKPEKKAIQFENPEEWALTSAEAKEVMKNFAREELKNEFSEISEYLNPDVPPRLNPLDDKQVERRFKDYLLRFSHFPDRVNYKNMESMSLKELDFIISPHCMTDEKIKGHAVHLKRVQLQMQTRRLFRK